MLHQGWTTVLEMCQICSECQVEFLVFIPYLILPVKPTWREEEMAAPPWCLHPEGTGTGALGPIA